MVHPYRKVIQPHHTCTVAVRRYQVPAPAHCDTIIRHPHQMDLVNVPVPHQLMAVPPANVPRAAKKDHRRAAQTPAGLGPPPSNVKVPMRTMRKPKQ